jgi:hypothetical protein
MRQVNNLCLKLRRLDACHHWQNSWICKLAKITALSRNEKRNPSNAHSDLVGTVAASQKLNVKSAAL